MALRVKATAAKSEDLFDPQNPRGERELPRADLWLPHMQHIIICTHTCTYTS